MKKPDAKDAIRPDSVAKRAARSCWRAPTRAKVPLDRPCRAQSCPRFAGRRRGGPSDRVARLIEQAHGEQPSAMRAEPGDRRDVAVADAAPGPSPNRAPPTNRSRRRSCSPTSSTFRPGPCVSATTTFWNSSAPSTRRPPRWWAVTAVGSSRIWVMAPWPCSPTREQAIYAAFEAITAISAIEVDGYRPQLRVGLHTGMPRAVDDDYLGVDVNIAARVGAAAGAGEVFISDAVVDEVDAQRFVLRRKRFRARACQRRPLFLGHPQAVNGGAGTETKSLLSVAFDGRYSRVAGFSRLSTASRRYPPCPAPYVAPRVTAAASPPLSRRTVTGRSLCYRY